MRFAKVITTIMLMTAMLLVFGCNPEDNPNNGGGNDNESLKVSTYEPQVVMQTSAICGGEVTKWSEGVELDELGVCWSIKNNPIVKDLHQSTSNWQEPFYYTLTGLELDTKYYVRAYAKKGEECYYGNEVSFTTLPVVSVITEPSVITMFVTDIGSDYAVVQGSVVGDGGKTVTERGFCWSDSHTVPTIEENHVANGSGLGDYSGMMTGLTPNTTYYVRAYAVNEVGVGYGNVACFDTDNNGGGGVDILPRISVISGNGLIGEGDVLELFELYELGFAMSSLAGLYSLEIKVNNKVWGRKYFNGEAACEYKSKIRFTDRSEKTITGIVTDNDYKIDSVSFKVCINPEIKTIDCDWVKLGGMQYIVHERDTIIPPCGGEFVPMRVIPSDCPYCGYSLTLYINGECTHHDAQGFGPLETMFDRVYHCDFSGCNGMSYQIHTQSIYGPTIPGPSGAMKFVLPSTVTY